MKSQERQFQELKGQLTTKYVQQAKYYTTKMNESLQKTAIVTVTNQIDQIYQKAVTKWSTQKSATMIKKSLTDMLQTLKKFL